jgi:hypothetical protein
MKNKTADGLRDRLFDVLDGIIAGKLKKDDVEAICYTSEQILKSAQIELETFRERNKAVQAERDFQLKLAKEKEDSMVMLSNILNEIEDEEE